MSDFASTLMNFMSVWCWLRKTVVSQATAPPSSSDVDMTSAALRLGVQTTTNADSDAAAARHIAPVAGAVDGWPCSAGVMSELSSRLPRTCIVYNVTKHNGHWSPCSVVIGHWSPCVDSIDQHKLLPVCTSQTLYNCVIPQHKARCKAA